MTEEQTGWIKANNYIDRDCTFYVAFSIIDVCKSIYEGI